jgi:hypothetical protein
MANAGAARGRPVAMATQEIHYASMAQVFEPSLTDSMIMRELKKLWSMVASQVHIAPLVWMTEYHCQQLGGTWMWLNLISIMVPTVTGNDTPIYQDRYMILQDYHRDIDLEITLETNVEMSGINPETLGFLIYPEGDEEEENSFEYLIMREFSSKAYSHSLDATPRAISRLVDLLIRLIVKLLRIS